MPHRSSARAPSNWPVDADLRTHGTSATRRDSPAHRDR
jgi:hypothetical protein